MVKLGSTLESSRKDGRLANSDNIYDKISGKMQEDINREVSALSPVDEEDLTRSFNDNGRSVTKFADRSYSPQNFSGKGYKILRKNIKPVSLAITEIVVSSVPTSDGYLAFIINGVESHVDVVASTDTTTDKVAEKITTKLKDTMPEYDVSKSASTITLTRKFGGIVSTPSSFSAVGTGASCIVEDCSKMELRNLLTAVMINQSNCIYEIRYDFDLNGATIEVPENCEFKFCGGSLNNGVLVLNKSYLSDNILILATVEGTCLNSEVNPIWFGADKTGKNDSKKAIQTAIDISYHVTIPAGDFLVNGSIYLKEGLTLEGIGGYSYLIQNSECEFLIDAKEFTQAICVKNLFLKCNYLSGGMRIHGSKNYVNTPRSYFENLWILGCADYGIKMIDKCNGYVFNNISVGNVRDRNEIKFGFNTYPEKQTLGIGIAASCSDSFFSNINVFWCNQWGINDWAGNLYTNIKAWGNGKYLREDNLAGNVQLNHQGSVFSNSSVEEGYGHGIVLNCNHATIESLRLLPNGQPSEVAEPTYDIVFVKDAHNNTIRAHYAKMLSGQSKKILHIPDTAKANNISITYDYTEADDNNFYKDFGTEDYMYNLSNVILINEKSNQEYFRNDIIHFSHKKEGATNNKFSAKNESNNLTYSIDSCIANDNFGYTMYISLSEYENMKINYMFLKAEYEFENEDMLNKISPFLCVDVINKRENNSSFHSVAKGTLTRIVKNKCLVECYLHIQTEFNHSDYVTLYLCINSKEAISEKFSVKLNDVKYSYSGEHINIKDFNPEKKYLLFNQPSEGFIFADKYQFIKDGHFMYYDLSKKKNCYMDGTPEDAKRSGSVAQRPNNVSFGFIYKNTETNKWEIFNGTTWENLDGTQIADITK